MFSRILGLLQGRKGSASIWGCIIACALVGVVALKSSSMSQLSFGSFSYAGDISIASEYALNEAEELRNTRFESVVNKGITLIPDSKGFFKEVVVTDSYRPVNSNVSVVDVKTKRVEIKIYKEDGAERNLCSSLVLNKVDPQSFYDDYNMVVNDSTSDSDYKAMSADAFKFLVDSKITDDDNYGNDDSALSAKAAKKYLADKLLDYAQKGNSVWYDGGSYGSPLRGVYVGSDGKLELCDIEFRGNRTNAADLKVVVPVKVGNIWHYDFINRKDLHNTYVHTLKFNFTINQTPHQTIIVTTDDGVQHTSNFIIKYGQKWTATITAENGYFAGILSATNGIAYGAVSLSASPAKMDTRLYGFEIGNGGGGRNVFYDCPSTYPFVGVPAGSDRLNASLRYTPSPYKNVVQNGGTVSLDFTAPGNCSMIAIQYTWHWGGDENPYVFSVTGNGKQWWTNFSGSGYSGPVGQIAWNLPTGFVKVTPGKTYHIVFSGHDGYKSRNYGLRFYWGAQINSNNYPVKVYGD